MVRTYPEYSCKLVGAENIKNYIFGGRGVVTLKSPSGIHHTYVFKRPREEDQFPSDVYFVYTLTHTNKLLYVGMIERNRFKITRGSRFHPDTPIVQGARYIMKMANTPDLQTPMELYHEGVCSICGRPLTSPKSLDIGIGPRCRHRL